MPKLDSELLKVSDLPLKGTLKTKTCSKCKEEKTVDCFGKDKSRNDGLHGYCKHCVNLLARDRHFRINKDKVSVAEIKRIDSKHCLSLGIKTCSICREEKTFDFFFKRKNSFDGFRKNCKDCCKKSSKEWRNANKDRVKSAGKEWRKNNPEKSDAIYARYRSTEKRRKIAREWARENRHKQSQYFRERYHSDEQFNLTIKYRRRIYMALKSQEAIKGSRMIALLGCSFPFYKEYITNMFTDGMSWDQLRQGNIHIDHRKPCASFDLTDMEQQKKCFHYSNLQPLWAVDNLKKGSKIL